MEHLRAEGAFRATVWVDLPAYHVADAATDALLWVLSRAQIGPGEGEPPASYWRQRAALYLGVIALRETRALLALIASGYEAETIPHARTLMEVFSRAQSVRSDESGSYARSWLAGRAGKPSAAFAKIDAHDLWGLMSHSSHADHRGVENMYAVTEEDGTTRLLVQPERRLEVSTGTLSMASGQVRDIAATVAAVFDLTVPNLDRLDAAIRSLPLWVDEAADGGATAEK